MPRNDQVVRQWHLLRKLEGSRGATLQELVDALPDDYGKNPRTIRRMTRDIDIVVELSEKDVDRFVEIFHEDFYLEPETVKEAVRKKGVFNLITRSMSSRSISSCARTIHTAAWNFRGRKRFPLMIGFSTLWLQKT